MNRESLSYIFTDISKISDKRIKGQFFLWGALLLVIAFFIGSVGLTQKIIVTESDDMSFYSDNIKKEIPKALNFGLNESNGTSTLVDFSRFLDSVLAERMIKYSSIWLVSEKNDTGVDITVGNFLDKNITITLNISTTSKNLFVKDNSTNKTTFTSVNPSFTLKIEYDGTTKTLNWNRDKVNLYVRYNLTRGKKRIIEEITG